MSRERSKFAGIRRFLVVLGVAVPLLARFAAAAEPGPDPLLALASDVWAQFELAYRSQPAEYERRQAQFNAVIEAWRATPASVTADQLLTDWMRAAIRASMPGSRTPLPPTPQFVPTVERQQPLAGLDLLRTQYAEPAATRAPFGRPLAAKITDPFQDDPIDKE